MDHKSIQNNGLRLTDSQFQQAEDLILDGWKVLQMTDTNILLERAKG